MCSSKLKPSVASRTRLVRLASVGIVLFFACHSEALLILTEKFLLRGKHSNGLMARCRTLEEMRMLKSSRCDEECHQSVCIPPAPRGSTVTTTTVTDPRLGTTTTTVTTVTTTTTRDDTLPSHCSVDRCIFFPQVCNHNRHVRDWCVWCTRRMLFPEKSVCEYRPTLTCTRPC